MCTPGDESNMTICPGCFKTQRNHGIHQYDEKSLKQKTHTELKKICDDLGLDYGEGKRVKRSKGCIALILDFQKNNN